MVSPSLEWQIDLGTTNCSLAYADSTAVADPQLPPVTLMPVPQLVNPGEVRDESTPSLFPLSAHRHGFPRTLASPAVG